MGKGVEGVGGGRGRKLRKCGIDALVIYHTASRWQVRQGTESKTRCICMYVTHKPDQRVIVKERQSFTRYQAVVIEAENVQMQNAVVGI
jgi:hypothetical protein